MKVENPDPLPEPSRIRLDPNKTALIIVDMQNDFADQRGKIYVGGMVRETIPRISALLTLARKNVMRVIYTQSWYEEGDSRFAENSRGRGRHRGGGCMAGSWGAEIIEELKMRRSDDEACVRKASYDCFFGTTMEKILEEFGLGRFESASVHANRAKNDFNVIVTGTVSNVCVDKAVIGLYHRGYEVVVPIDCVSTRTQYEQEWSLRQFHTFYAAKLTRSDLISFAQNTPVAPKASSKRVPS